MNGRPHHSESRLQAAWRARRWWALACFLLGPLAGYGIARGLPATYVSSATLEWNAAQFPASQGQPTRVVPAVQDLASVEERVLTREHLGSLMERFNLYAEETSGAAGTDRVARLRRDLVVALAGHGIQVSFSAGDAQLAQRVCAGIVALFLEQNGLGGGDANRAAAAPLAAQIQEAKRRLDQQESRLVDLRRRNRSERIDDAVAPELSLVALNTQLGEAQAEVRRATEDKALSQKLLERQLAEWHSAPPAASAETQAMEQELAAKQVQLAALETRYTRDHPDVVKLSNDIIQLQAKLDGVRKLAQKVPGADPSGEPAQIAQTRAQIHQLDLVLQAKEGERERLRQAIQSAESRKQSASSREQELNSLVSSRDAAQSAYDSLLAKQKQAEAAVAGQPRRQVAEFQVIAPPSLPLEPSSPSRLAFAFGGAGSGIGLGLLTILVSAWSDTALRTPADVERDLQLPVLAILPATGEQLDTIKNGERSAGRRRPPDSREASGLADI